MKTISNLDQKVGKQFDVNWDNIDWGDSDPKTNIVIKKAKGRKSNYDGEIDTSAKLSGDGTIAKFPIIRDRKTGAALSYGARAMDSKFKARS